MAAVAPRCVQEPVVQRGCEEVRRLRGESDAEAAAVLPPRARVCTPLCKA